MDGRAGVQPTETDGPVESDELRGPSASEKPDELASVPLTIREVVRRGRLDRNELDRLRAEIDRLRLRAESAEHLLQAKPDDAATNGVAPIARNGQAAADGQGAVDGQGVVDGQARAARRPRQPPTASSSSRWATAAVLPSSRDH
ncbi:MAG: hypothetical protein ACLPVY_23840 [Acidimicrobiia bacterium]